jgi:lysophospholipase L1-like esterase
VKIGSPLAGRPDLVKKDGVHPNTEGQNVLGQAVNKAVGRP